jgi:hypothetical protein
MKRRSWLYQKISVISRYQTTETTGTGRVFKTRYITTEKIGTLLTFFISKIWYKCVVCCTNVLLFKNIIF